MCSLVLTLVVTENIAAFRGLSRNNNVTVAPSAKGGGVVIMYYTQYNTPTELFDDKNT